MGDEMLPFDANPDVHAERQRQRSKGYTPEHDDEHRLRELAGYADQRLARLLGPAGPSLTDFDEKSIVQARALLLAVVESAERKIAAASPGERGDDVVTLREGVQALALERAEAQHQPGSICAERQRAELNALDAVVRLIDTGDWRTPPRVRNADRKFLGDLIRDVQVAVEDDVALNPNMTAGEAATVAADAAKRVLLDNAEFWTGTPVDPSAEREFLAASVAVWREIDRLAAEPGGYQGLDESTALRRAERAAWERYRDGLPAVAALAPLLTGPASPAVDREALTRRIAVSLHYNTERPLHEPDDMTEMLDDCTSCPVLAEQVVEGLAVFAGIGPLFTGGGRDG